MKTLRNLALIACLPILAASSCGSESDDIRDQLEFLLNKSSDETLENWKNASDASLSDCTQNGGFNNETRARLYKLISAGDAYAFQAGLLAFSCWGGGELEDFYRSSGQFFDHRSDEFMRLTVDYRVSHDHLESMVTMLPLELVDNFDGKLALVEQRLAVLQGIKDTNTQLLIQSLEESKSRLEMTIREMRAQHSESQPK